MSVLFVRKKALMREHIRQLKPHHLKRSQALIFLCSIDQEKLESEITFVGGNLPVKTLYKSDMQSFKAVLEDGLIFNNMRKRVYNPEHNELNSLPDFKQLVQNSEIELRRNQLEFNKKWKLFQCVKNIPFYCVSVDP